MKLKDFYEKHEGFTYAILPPLITSEIKLTAGGNAEFRFVSGRDKDLLDYDVECITPKYEIIGDMIIPYVLVYITKGDAE